MSDAPDAPEKVFPDDWTAADYFAYFHAIDKTAITGLPQEFWLRLGALTGYASKLERANVDPNAPALGSGGVRLTSKLTLKKITKEPREL
jgi:hypothetical protein